MHNIDVDGFNGPSSVSSQAVKTNNESNNTARMPCNFFKFIFYLLKIKLYLLFNYE